MAICKVCEKAESKYKCPTCRAPYCSLICFKQHKETPCEPPTPTQEQHTRKEITPISPPDEEDPSRLTPQDLEKLQYAKEIHDFLQYPQLRDIITKLDTSKQPEKDLDLIRAQDPVFDEFTKLLVDITFKDKLAAFQQKK
ncbi:hypothetical protein V8B55DRAFT_1471086 [Mucor lusitanicus]|uniref:HIT-type domain-containing protein n=2 Tax=Mucor circinelloides f. lusitanicus TaxID=29924 RepID=A0A168P8R5_MUCCL|nr:hypothetical protein FB192DRAFT_1372909 [Mucor lusitanicus]OAD07345.1 hypothetical protein MUCCIDRAFT_104269 [Mucor lusitanicus CBS 277.49]